MQESYSHYQKPTEKIDLTSKDALPGLLNLGSMAVGTAGQSEGWWTSTTRRALTN